MLIKQDFFELFSLTRNFDVDLTVLRQRYRDLQAALHPDKHINGTDQERRISLQQAAHVNAGYQTLKDVLLRARYLLSLKGVDEASEHTTIRDLAFLEEQIELRECLAEIKQDADPLAALFHFIAELNGKEKKYTSELRACFADSGEDALTRAQQIVHRMQFICKLVQDAETLEEDFV